MRETGLLGLIDRLKDRLLLFGAQARSQETQQSPICEVRLVEQKERHNLD